MSLYGRVGWRGGHIAETPLIGAGMGVQTGVDYHSEWYHLSRRGLSVSERELTEARVRCEGPTPEMRRVRLNVAACAGRRLDSCLRETSPPQSGIMGKRVRRVFALNGSSRAQRARSIFSRYVILGARESK